MLLANHIPDLDFVQAGFRVLLDVDVDGKMCVDVAHLVFEPSCDPDDQVIDDCLDRPEGCNIFASAMVEFDVDGVFIWLREADGKVGKVFE